MKYQNILYFIGLIILTTLCIQVYWNYKNYQTGKQQLVNDVQTSLDNAVDQYFTQLATNSHFPESIDSVGHTAFSMIKSRKVFGDSMVMIEEPLEERISGMTIVQSSSKDSLDLNITIGDSIWLQRMEEPIFEFLTTTENPITDLSAKIVLSFSESELSLATIDSLFADELQRKNIQVDYGLSHGGHLVKKEELRPEIIAKSSLQTQSKSPYFFRGNDLKAHFTNITLAVLKKNLVGIMLSFLLVGGVVLCLLYLLKIIRHQKQLAEIKNDLISNITHEFKTPIATIGIAMEAIQNFNEAGDAEKNLRYAEISREQVNKLNLMVEKLLETATLDSDKLELNFEPTNLVALVEKATQKEEVALGPKSINLNLPDEPLLVNVDMFHFENAINNIIDNAIKYGGDTISVDLKPAGSSANLMISDSGSSLTTEQAEQIFEKFYRVPKGNTHDIKGFGIGLYYTKKIIEKHNGSIQLTTKPHTQFQINIPLE